MQSPIKHHNTHTPVKNPVYARYFHIPRAPLQMSSLPVFQIRETEALRGSGAGFVGRLLTPAGTPSIEVCTSCFTDL